MRSWMKPGVFAAGIIIAWTTLAGAADAQGILIQRSFWSGWKYSVDGDDLRGVGSKGEALRAELAGNGPALAELDGYGSKRVWSQIIGAGAGGIAIASVYYSLDNDEWDAQAIAMAAGSAVLSMVAGYLSTAANNHLIRAVHLHNFGTASASIHQEDGASREFDAVAPEIGIGLAFSF